MGGAEACTPEERRPLFRRTTDELSGGQASNTENDPSDETNSAFDGLDRVRLWRLYVSHFLSTWNTHTFLGRDVPQHSAPNIAAVTGPNPGNEIAILTDRLSGVLVNLSTLCFSPTIGRCIDHSVSRLRPLQLTIFLQRASIFLACVFWASVTVSKYLSKEENGHDDARELVNRSPEGKIMIVVPIAILFGVVESLCAVGNNISMERDWVPAIATPTSNPSIYTLSARMKRIDLVSKLVAPAFVSIVQTWTASASTVAVILAVQNLLSLGPEWFAVQSVWKDCPPLRRDRSTGQRERHIQIWDPRQFVEEFRLYFGCDAWIASLSSALQSFSILSMSGLMTTYLIAIGYSLTVITEVRVLSSIVELAPTVIAPWIISWLSKDDSDVLRPLLRLGAWGLGWQTLCLIWPTIGLFSLQRLGNESASAGPSLGLTASFFGFLSLSRFGAWTHNLVAQNIVQITVDVQQRGRFSGVEMAFVSAAEIARWTCGAVWSRPEQFPDLGIASFCMVTFSYLLFLVWAVRWKRRARDTIMLE